MTAEDLIDKYGGERKVAEAFLEGLLTVEDMKTARTHFVRRHFVATVLSVAAWRLADAVLSLVRELARLSEKDD